MKAVMFAGLILLASGAVSAQGSGKVFDWVNSQEEMSAISQLMASYAGGLACDRLVNTDVAAAFIKVHFGNRTFSADEVAKIMKGLLGVEAMEGMVGNDRRRCAVVRHAFGPNGTSIRGLLD